MKKTIFLLIAIITLVSCMKDGGRGEFKYLRSYISAYFEGAPKFKVYINKENNLICIRPDLGRETKLYYAPELGSVGAEAERFLQLAKRNGDLNYNREVSWSPGVILKSNAEEYVAINVVCTNTAWDVNHSTGVSLNDLATVEYYSYTPYIQSGYIPTSEDRVEKPLSELKENDLTMLCENSPTIYFHTLPAPGSYELEMTLTTTEGVEKRATCTVVVK